jgi:hypothetical protein
METTPRRPGPLQRTTRIALSVLLVLSHPLWAATIIVDEKTCTLVDAVTAANTDHAAGGCVAGSGDDRLVLTTDVSLTAPYVDAYGSDTAFPVITSEITIDGNGFTIERDPGAPPFRLFAVGTDGTLQLNDASLIGGDAGSGALNGGAVYNEGTTRRFSPTAR